MPAWTPHIAVFHLEHFGLVRHHPLLKKAAHFRVSSIRTREIVIPLDRLSMVTAYVNSANATGKVYPAAGIEGIEITKRYPLGYTSSAGNPGIAHSVALHNPSLNPKFNETLRIKLRDESSLDRLLAWYLA